MSVADPRLAQQSTRDRLVAAANALVHETGSGGLTVEAVAQHARVSRATAYRHFGDRQTLIIKAATARVREHVKTCHTAMNQEDSVVAKLDAGYVHLTQALPADPMIAELSAFGDTRAYRELVEPDLFEMFRSVLETGRDTGETRDDVLIEDMAQFLVEELFLMADLSDSSASRVRRRFQTFIVPALAPRPYQSTAVAFELSRMMTAMDELRASVAALADHPSPERGPRGP